MSDPFGALPSLAGARWVLTEVDGERVPPGDGESAAHLVFDPDASRVSGSGGCNRLTGSFELEGASLRFGPVATTLMYCGDEAMRIERAFLAALGTTRCYATDGSTLTLLDGERVLARLVASDAALE